VFSIGRSAYHNDEYDPGTSIYWHIKIVNGTKKDTMNTGKNISEWRAIIFGIYESIINGKVPWSL